MKDTSRREFLSLSLALGILGVLPVASLPEFAWAMEDENIYFGPMVDRMNDLILKASNRKISDFQLLMELKKRYADFDAPRELAPFLDRGTESDILTLHKTKIKRNGQKTKFKMQLFFIPPGISHPPHAHEGLVSMQSLVLGSLELREYKRYGTLENSLQVTPVTNTIIRAGDQMETSQTINNVHWFGAIEPSVMLNMNITRHDMNAPSEVAELTSESRIYIDPTTPIDKGIIDARILTKDEAEARFQRILPSQA